MIELPPAVVVHDLAQARRCAGRKATLISAPGAAQFAGVLWWRELLVAAEWAGPALLDCGDGTGRALEALRLGLPGIILRANPAAVAVAGEIAAAQNAVLLAVPPPALDLGVRGAQRQLLAWLGG